MFPFLLGLVVLATGGAAAFVAESRGPIDPQRVYAGSLGALLFLLGGTWIEAYATRKAPGRARVDLWGAVQAAALALSVAAWMQVSPLFQRPTYLTGVSSRWEQLEPEHFAVPLVAMVAAYVLGRRPVPSHLPTRAALSVVVAVALLALAERRVRTAVAPWHLVDALPVVATLPPLEGAAATITTRHTGFVVRRYRSALYPGYCDLRAARSEEALPESVPGEHLVPVGCGTLTLRALPVTGEYVVVQPFARYRNAFVFDRDTLERRPWGNATIGQYARLVAPPAGWVRTSWWVLATALLALIPRRDARRWLSARDRWRGATLDASGVVHFEDGSTAPMTYGHALTPGPVVVLGGDAPRDGAAPFRAATHAQPLARDDVRAGTLASVGETLDAGRDAMWARITATAWLAAAPLAPYVAFGVLP